MDNPIKNIAIVAHVDAGKTTLSERLLYFGGAIQQIGEVEEGLTTMDHLQEEQIRGITIEAGMASFIWKGTKYTLLDTPGHVDFENEIDVSLHGVEGAILLISAPSGLEVQTLQGWKKLRSNSIPPVIFLNKMDHWEKDVDDHLKQISEKLEIEPVLMSLPLIRNDVLAGVIDVFNEVSIYPDKENPKKFYQGPVPRDQFESFNLHRQNLYSAATEIDTTLTENILNGENVDKKLLMDGLSKTFAFGKKVPVYCGSAKENIGIRQLLNGCHFFFPVPRLMEDSKSWAKVLRIRRWGKGYLSLLKLYLPFPGELKNPPDICQVQGGQLEFIPKANPGEIVGIYEKSFPKFKIGDEIGLDGKIHSSSVLYSYLPLLNTRLEAINKDDFQKIDSVLTEWDQLDDSIRLKYEKETGNWLLSTLGEVQLEVLKERLENITGSKLKMGEPSIQYFESWKSNQETFINSGEMNRNNLEIVMTLENTGLFETGKLINSSEYQDSVYSEAMKSAFNSFIQGGIRGFGPLVGLDLVIESIRVSNKDFPVSLLYKVLQDGLRLRIPLEEVDILEPFVDLQVSTPISSYGYVVEDLQSKGAEITKMDTEEDKSIVLAKIPLQKLFNYATTLRSLSKGQGTYRMTYRSHFKHEEVKI